ncbi:MAG: T9SS type A sorting domain-containing protein [Cytophagales bacterium]
MVYLAGRDAQLLCLNGKDGSLIWEFWSDSSGTAADFGWYNFYNPRFIGEEGEHLLISNGGDASSAANDPDRPPGKLLILDRFSGEILYEDKIPDKAETYFSAMLWPNTGKQGEDLIVLGSGGETLPGAIWTFELSEFKANGMSNAQALIADDKKGFIQAPAFADLNSDGLYEMIVPRMNNGGLIAIDAQTKEEWWRFEVPNTECYASPIVADFSGDGLPDVFNLFARGEYPIYFNYIAHLINGQSGKSLYSESLTLNQFSSGNALDWDEDGADELLLIENKIFGAEGLKHAFRILDFNNDTSYYITEFKRGMVIYSTPLIRDIDADGLLEILYVFNPDSTSLSDTAKVAFGRFDLDLPAADIAWAGFMGTYEDGTYRKNLTDSTITTGGFDLNIFPNPTNSTLRIINKGIAIDRIQFFDLQGKAGNVEINTIGKNTFIDTGQLRSGLYFLRVSTAEKVFSEKILIER